jgi:hypothetical protein
MGSAVKSSSERRFLAALRQYTKPEGAKDDVDEPYGEIDPRFGGDVDRRGRHVLRNGSTSLIETGRQCIA